VILYAHRSTGGYADLSLREFGFADHELRKSVFESLGPNAWGMYILLPIPFLALGVIGYFVYRAWRASGSEGSPPSLN
jgi:hypothetical protein